MLLCSVLIPVFNAEKYILNAVNSVANSSITDTEIIVIDDGSTDNTPRILYELAREIPALRIIVRENRGMVRTLADLVHEARGRYLVRMDADDISLPGRIEKQISYLESNKSCVGVGGQVEFIDPHQRPICAVSLPLSHQEIVDGLFLENEKALVPLIHPAMTLVREAVLSVGNYDTFYEAAEDRDLWLRLSEIGLLANLTDTVLKYRLHFDSFSHMNADKQRKYRAIAISRARVRCGRDTPIGWTDPIAAGPIFANETKLSWAKKSIQADNFATAIFYLFNLSLRQPFNVQVMKSWVRLTIKIFSRLFRGRL